jgi:hypothetical protein
MSLPPQPADFADIADLIANAKQRAVQAVNTTLIELYWSVGERISRKIAASEWGDGVVEQLARYLAQTQPGLRGFTRANLFRMKQFYEAYPDVSIVSAALRQLPWTHQVEQPPTGAPDQSRVVRAHGAQSRKGFAHGATNAPRGCQRVQRQLPAGVSGAAPKPCRSGSAPRPAAAPEGFSD